MNKQDMKQFEQLLQVLGDTDNRVKAALLLGEDSAEFFKSAENAGSPYIYHNVEGIKPLLIEAFDEDLQHLINELCERNIEPAITPLDMSGMIDMLIDAGLENIYAGRVTLDELGLIGEVDPFITARKILSWTLPDAIDYFGRQPGSQP